MACLVCRHWIVWVCMSGKCGHVFLNVFCYVTRMNQKLGCETVGAFGVITGECQCISLFLITTVVIHTSKA
jgi:hypothetical protein